MKTVLFCQNAYAFGILKPIMNVLKEREYPYLWFIVAKLAKEFPYVEEPVTQNIEDLVNFTPDVLYVPGNEVPHYLRGLKVQVFHGLAGEKKGHFRIRHYFDLYLTQGPYFTRKFKELQQKFGNFEVVETGWPKLDIYSSDRQRYDAEKKTLLEKSGCNRLLLYAPTFSPSLTSAPHLLGPLEELAKDKNLLILIKFHDLMDSRWISAYAALADRNVNIILEQERNVVKFLLMADLMVSDTSSVVYEFLLLDKPVVTFKSASERIQWDNRNDYNSLKYAVQENMDVDPFSQERASIIENYHPYNDGLSAVRMVDAVENHIETFGVPIRRKLSFLRRRKINRLFGTYKT